jgi:hypothetical protein
LCDVEDCYERFWGTCRLCFRPYNFETETAVTAKHWLLYVYESARILVAGVSNIFIAVKKNRFRIVISYGDSLFFSEGRGSIFVRNADSGLTKYTGSHSRIHGHQNLKFCIVNLCGKAVFSSEDGGSKFLLKGW